MKKTFNKPDLHAPRFRSKRFSLLKRETYNNFIKKYPEHKNLSLSGFKEIIKKFNSLLTNGIIDNRDGIELPEGLGFIFMGTCPPTKKQNIDIVKSLQYGIVTNHKNWDSDNKLLKIFYTNHTTKYPFKNKRVWSFKAVKHFRQQASKEYKEDWTKYIVVDSTRKISSMFTKMRQRDYMIKEAYKIPENYDEFKI